MLHSPSSDGRAKVVELGVAKMWHTEMNPGFARGCEAKSAERMSGVNMS